MRNTFFMLCICAATTGMAQSRHHFRVGLSGLPQQAFTFGYELRLSQSSSLDVWGGFRQYALPEGVFHGDRIVYYTEEREEAWRVTYGDLLAVLDWHYVGSGRPLPLLPERVTAQTLHFQVGYKFSFQRDSSRWRLFLQPGVGGAGYESFDIRDKTGIQDRVFYSTITGNYPNEIRTDTQLTAYKQTRQMRLQTDWVYGLRYNFGLTWFAHRNIFLEGRVHGGMNLTDAPSHRPPNLVRPFYIGFGVEAGVCF